MPDKMRVIIAGGGTGGHLFPAMAIGEELRRCNVDVLYMGSKYGIEARKLPEAGESPVLLNISGIQRGFDLDAMKRNLVFPYRFISSLVQSMKVIRDFDPQVIVGTGGYSSGLPLIAGLRLRRKTLIQEQNSYPGMTVRKLSDKVDRMCLGFAEAAKHLKKKIGFIPGILFVKE